MTVAQGQNTTLQVTLAGTASGATITATCLNLPAGASCTYDNTTKVVTIATTAGTPKGSYQILVMFSATQQVASARHRVTYLAAWTGLNGLPFGFLWLGGLRTKEQRRRTIGGLVLGLMLILWLVGCGGGASHQTSTTTPVTPPTTVTSQSSISATLTVN